MAARKKMTEDEQKEKYFREMNKLYFSSLSSRATQYAYLNVIPNTIMLSNSTTSGPASEHGDRIMDYSVGELCFHLVRPKDLSWLEELQRFLILPNTETVCIRLNSLMNWLGKYARKDVEVGWAGDTLVMRPKKRESWDGRNVIGFVVRNFHIIKQLQWWGMSIDQIGSEEHQKEYPNHTEKCDINVPISGRVFFTKVHTNWYRNQRNEPIFPAEQGYQQEIEQLGLDGMSCVSLREFIKKFKDDTYTFTWYSWVVYGAIFSMTQFTNEIVSVKSIRPYTPIIPLQLHTTPTTEFLQSQPTTALIN